MVATSTDMAPFYPIAERLGRRSCFAAHLKVGERHLYER